MATKKKKEELGPVAVRKVHEANTCLNAECKFFSRCEYYENGTVVVPDPCRVCVFYAKVRFNYLLAELDNG
jgi:hypothetical protein